MSNNSRNAGNPQINPQEEIDFGTLLKPLFKHKWLLISGTLLGIVAGTALTFIQTPVYQTNALLKVQEKPLSDNKSAVLAEIEQLKSRTVLSKTVAILDLDIQIKPEYYPFLGEALARHHENSDARLTLAEPLFSKTEFAWGGESLKISSLTLPDDWQGKTLTLIAGNQNNYQLIKDGEVLLSGEVGKTAERTLDQQRGTISLLVSELKARPETRFSLVKLSEENAINQLSNSINIAEKGKDSHILELAIQSANPLVAMNTLNQFIDIYLQKNVGSQSSEIEKTSDLLEKQMLTLRNKIDASSLELDNYKAKNRSVDVNFETQRLLTDISNLKNQISQLQLKHDELRQKFTESHPYVETLNRQIKRLNEELNAHNRSLDALPQTQQVIQKLTQDIDVNSKLYATLLEKAQKVRVDTETNGEKSTIIDYAQLVNKPLRPNKPLIVGIATLMGLLLGIITAYIRQAMNKGIEDPNIIEKELNVRIFASVPHSKNQLVINQNRDSGKINPNQAQILALDHKDDLAVESLRNLRTNLHFSLLDSQKNVIMITGPSPGIGKSFISINLACLLADSGKKVLLIDADMRKGIINKSLGLPRERGLSELISNQISREEAIKPIANAHFDFIPTGVLPPNPSELLLHEHFNSLIETFSKQYDQIIIDTPPILAVTDASIVGRLAGVSLMVVKAGKHPLNELEQSVKSLLHAGVSLKGIIFNDYTITSVSDPYHNQYVYQYNYKND